MKLRSSDTGRKYAASRCPRVMTRVETAQTIRSATMPPVRISRFFLRRHKITCPNGFLYAKHTIRKNRLQGERAFERKWRLMQAPGWKPPLPFFQHTVLWTSRPRPAPGRMRRCSEETPQRAESPAQPKSLSCVRKPTPAAYFLCLCSRAKAVSVVGTNRGMLFSRQSRSFQNDAEVSDCLNFDTGTLRKRSDLHAGAGWQVLFEKLGVRRVYGRKHGQVCDKNGRLHNFVQRASRLLQHGGDVPHGLPGHFADILRNERARFRVDRKLTGYKDKTVCRVALRIRTDCAGRFGCYNHSHKSNLHLIIRNAGVVGLKGGKDVRQPVDCHAGKGVDAHDAGFHTVHPADLPLQRLLLLQEPAQKRQHLRSGRGQANAAFAAFEKRHAPFLLQIGNHLADRGLRVGKRLRRAGKTAGLDRLDKGKVF